MWGFVFRNAFSDRSHEERTVRLQWAEVLATNVAKHAFEKHAFEIIRLLTRDNPAQILVSAIINGAPRGDSTRHVRTHTCWEVGDSCGNTSVEMCCHSPTLSLLSL